MAMLTPLEERLARDECPDPGRALRAQSRPRSAAAWSRTAAPRRWPGPCASPCPRTSTSCTPPATSWSRCAGAIQPLTRKLAVRLARKRRHGRRGPLDFRSTVRHSLSTGGVPLDPRFRYPRPAKPEIMVIADISGSVASFARFTLHLVYAISSQFSKVRSFVFIDGIDEVTQLLRGDRRLGRGGPPDQHRGRRHLGRRPLRLRARAASSSGSAGARRSRRGPASSCSATPATTTTPPRRGC